MKNLRLLAICLVSLTSCREGPKVTVCISDPVNDGFQCADMSNNKFYLPYKESDNYIALNPDDARELFEFCKRNK